MLAACSLRKSLEAQRKMKESLPFYGAPSLKRRRTSHRKRRATGVVPQSTPLSLIANAAKLPDKRSREPVSTRVRRLAPGGSLARRAGPAEAAVGRRKGRRSSTSYVPSSSSSSPALARARSRPLASACFYFPLLFPSLSRQDGRRPRDRLPLARRRRKTRSPRFVPRYGCEASPFLPQLTRYRSPRTSRVVAVENRLVLLVGPADSSWVAIACRVRATGLRFVTSAAPLSCTVQSACPVAHRRSIGRTRAGTVDVQPFGPPVCATARETRGPAR